MRYFIVGKETSMEKQIIRYELNKQANLQRHLLISCLYLHNRNRKITDASILRTRIGPFITNNFTVIGIYGDVLFFIFRSKLTYHLHNNNRGEKQSLFFCCVAGF